MRVQIVKVTPSGKFKIRYRSFWCWYSMTKYIPSIDYDIEGNMIDHSYHEDLVFNTFEEALEHVTSKPVIRSIEVVKEIII